MRREAGGLSGMGSRARAALLAVAALAASALAGMLGQGWASRLGLLLGGGVGLVLLLQAPGLGLVALAALSLTLPLTIGTGSEVSLTPPVLLIPAITAVWLVDGLRRRSLEVPHPPTTLPLVLFVASGLVSLLAGQSYWDPLVPRSGNLLLVQLAQVALFALSAAIFLVAKDLGRRGPWLRLATWAFLAMGALTALPWLVPRLWRVVFWVDEANSGLLWSWLGALAAGQLLFNRRLGRGAKAGLLVLLLAAGYVVFVRRREWLSGWVPYTVAVAAVAWLWVWRRRRAVGLLALVAMVALATVLFPAIYEYAGGDFEWGVSGGGRMLLYERTLELVEDHPILGLGPAAYRHYGFTRWLSLGAGRALYLDPRISSHNNYIDVYAQMGLVGLALFAWFLAALGWAGWGLRTRFDGDFEDGYVHGALGGLAGTLVAMMLVDWFLPFVYNVGFPGFRMSALAWMFLGGLVALEKVARDRAMKGGESEAEKVGA